jgi:PAS domain S-box-containing protein
MAKSLQRQVRTNEKLSGNAFARAILEASPICMFFCDDNGQCLYANPAYEELTGFEIEKFFGNNWEEIVHPEDRGRVVTEWKLACAVGAPFENTYRIISKDGLVIWVKTTANKVTHDSLSGYVGTVENITVLKDAEMTKMNSWRLERLEEFVATLVHDLKAPLVGADRVLEMLVNRSMGDLNSRQLDAIALLKAGNNHKLAMIQKLLDVYLLESGQQEFHFEPLNVRAVISDSIIDSAKLAEQKNIRVEFDCVPNLRTPIADRRGVTEVMNNLLHNALTYSPEGGLVQVQAQNNHKYVVIRVIDTGPGISPEDQAYLFYHFAQGQSGGHYVANTGFGLYISRLIVEAHGGTISCRSEQGLGSVFTVMLPFEAKK